jgi:hypothetical protein
MRENRAPPSLSLTLSFPIDLSRRTEIESTTYSVAFFATTTCSGGGLVFGASKAIKELREEVAKLKRMIEERDLDWIDMRSRCKRLLDRTEKAAHSMRTPEPSEEPAPENGAGLNTVAAPGRLLTPHQIEIQQQILRRRAGGGA